MLTLEILRPKKLTRSVANFALWLTLLAQAVNLLPLEVQAIPESQYIGIQFVITRDPQNKERLLIRIGPEFRYEHPDFRYSMALQFELNETGSLELLRLDQALYRDSSRLRITYNPKLELQFKDGAATLQLNDYAMPRFNQYSLEQLTDILGRLSLATEKHPREHDIVVSYLAKLNQLNESDAIIQPKAQIDFQTFPVPRLELQSDCMSGPETGLKSAFMIGPELELRTEYHRTAPQVPHCIDR